MSHVISWRKIVSGSSYSDYKDSEVRRWNLQKGQQSVMSKEKMTGNGSDNLNWARKGKDYDFILNVGKLPHSVQELGSVQPLSRVQLFATSWTTACWCFLSITSSQSLLKLMSIKSVMPSTISSSVVPFSSCLQSFPASGSFPMSQFFTSGDQNIGVSASAPVLPMNIQDWSPLGWTGWISLQAKELSRVFFNTTVQKHQFFSTQLSL